MPRTASTRIRRAAVTLFGAAALLVVAPAVAQAGGHDDPETRAPTWLFADRVDHHLHRNRGHRKGRAVLRLRQFRRRGRRGLVRWRLAYSAADLRRPAGLDLLRHLPRPGRGRWQPSDH